MNPLNRYSLIDSWQFVWRERPRSRYLRSTIANRDWKSAIQISFQIGIRKPGKQESQKLHFCLKHWRQRLRPLLAIGNRKSKNLS
jgi:hypothetical protein